MMIKKENLLVALAVCFAVTACGGNKEADQAATQAEQDHVQNGIAVADSDDPNRWAPTAQSMSAAQSNNLAPEIRVGDLSSLKGDPSLGQMELLPPPAAPPKLEGGDEADQYGLPEWEKMARGELHPKRIQY